MMSHIFYFTFDGVRMHLDTGIHCAQALFYPRDDGRLLKHVDGFFMFTVYAAAQIHAGRAMLALMRATTFDDARVDALEEELWADWRGWLLRQAEERWPTHGSDEVEARLQDYCDRISSFFVCDDSGFVFRGRGATAQGGDD